MKRNGCLSVGLFLVSIIVIWLMQMGVAFAYTPLICIDAGHGGYDTGAVGPTGYREKDANLDISLRLRDLLQNRGYQIIMTRDVDEYITLQRRCDIGNGAGASIFVAIHNNAAAGGSGNGTETYYWRNGGEYSPEGEVLATCIHNELTKEIQRSDRGVKGANFYVLRNSGMPSALVEGAFISNPTEEQLLKDPNFRQRIAQGVFNGIDVYFSGVTSTTFTLPPNSRKSVDISRLIFGKSVSTKVTSDQPITTERAMYFNYNGKDGGHDSIGVTSPSNTWYLAEGYTGGDFDEYVLIQNPNSQAANTTVTFMLSNGTTRVGGYSLAPNSRYTIHVDEILPNDEVSTKIVSDVPVIAERAMYFNYNGKDGGHDSIGVTSTSNTWYLAEGYTGGDFDTWVLIQNPNSSASNIKATFMKRDGGTEERNYTVEANSRFTIYVDGILPNDEVSTKIESTNGVGIIAERAMYFNYNGKDDGHDSIGVTSPSNTWYLAEGYTGGDFDTYILIQNPNTSWANTTVTYMFPNGTTNVVNYAIAPNSRYTIHVDGIYSDTSVSTKIESDQPVIAERSMYFNYQGRMGGHNSTGTTALATTWYLAEGYTGAGFSEWILIQNPNPNSATVTLDFMK